MTVRDETAKTRRESGARRPEVLRPTRAVRRGTEGRARQTELARAAAFDHLAAERSFASARIPQLATGSLVIPACF